MPGSNVLKKMTVQGGRFTFDACQGRLANPRHGFLLILRPEDQLAGAPDPVRWIDPLMKHQGLDYRISLLRAAAFHGSSHQAAMVFQVVAPKQLRDLEVGRHRLQFLYQSPRAFARGNQPNLLRQIKSDAGYAKVAGVELTLLDCVRYFHKATGINGVAQIVKDIGVRAEPRVLASAAPLLAKGGSIVVTTSFLNEVGAPGLSILSATKAAVGSLVRSLGAELAPRGIRVNAVSPGPISTPFHGKLGLSEKQLNEAAARSRPRSRFIVSAMLGKSPKQPCSSQATILLS
jgi:hypothetical protein